MHKTRSTYAYYLIIYYYKLRRRIKDSNEAKQLLFLFKRHLFHSRCMLATSLQQKMVCN
ncbi:hypothetical protein HanRHA438_Chr12g0569021 [Helianthus annuus]|nr:hypothetical protein HanRHA438_Chr12g0569021 [Helianthus annuus]